MTTRLSVYPLTQIFEVLAGSTNKIVARCRKGNDLVIELHFVDADGDAVDISAYTTRAFEGHDEGGAVAALTKTPALVGGGTGGVMTVTFTDGDTAALTGEYQIELQVVGTGIKGTPVVGTLIVEGSYA